ncbi:MAG TPA: BatA domain-containing protein, partial [Planctomycetaceae bacterium]|nr:BatA domain-containing protein [Planctomycetaceae bacterium]
MPDFLQTSFLLGAAAIAVPILIHLFFRLKTKRVELGTIRFLRVVLEENTRRRKVMRWLLLALRMGFVALLAALFARPFWTAAATGGDRDLLVILIDQSATMQLKGDSGRLIDQAVSEARRLIESTGKNTRCEVAYFDHAVHPIGADGERKPDGDALLRKLQAPEATYGATNFGAAIAWARDICVKSPAGAKRLHLFTDLQRSGLDWTEVEPLPADVQASLHDLGKPVVNNVAVTEVRTPRLWVRPGESSSVRASILHGGAFALEEVSVVMEVGRVPERETSAGDQPIVTDFAKLAERITRRERVKLEPGATVVLDFELPTLSRGLWQGRVVVEHPDDLPFDNQRYFAVSATPAHRVLVVHGGEGPTSPLTETYFLEAALRLSNDDAEFTDSPFLPTVLSYDDGAGLPTLADFDAVVLANVPALKDPDATQLAAFVRSGGGLLVFTGDKVTAAATLSLDRVGLAVGTIGDVKIAVDLPWRLNSWDERHPIFQPLSDPQHGDLRRLIFAAYTDIAPATDAVVLARFNTEAPAVLECRVGQGTVVWVTTSCGREWSDWCRTALFLPTVHQLLGYEVGLTSGGRVRPQLMDAVALAAGEAQAVVESQLQRASQPV